MPIVSAAAAVTLQWGRGLLTPEMYRRAPAAYPVGQLQWGRGLLTPEIAVCVTCAFDAEAASMGPGSFDPGNRRSADPR